MSEAYWMERAQSAEARIETIKQSHEAAIERVKQFKTNFGVRERSDGNIDIDFEKFVQALGMPGAMALRQVIDETYHVSGNPGEKPHIKPHAV